MAHGHGEPEGAEPQGAKTKGAETKGEEPRSADPIEYHPIAQKWGLIGPRIRPQFQMSLAFFLVCRCICACLLRFLLFQNG